jgi:radical SAM protein with 4Fe4S-binding SPASM domain
MTVSDNESFYNETLYQSSKKTVIKEKDNSFIVINPDGPTYRSINTVQKKIVELCNGTMTAQEIANRLSQECGLDKNQTMNFIRQFIKSNLISTVPPSEVRPTPRLKILGTLVIHLTEECNLRCKHCCFEAGIALRNELSSDEFLKLLRDFVKLGGKLLLITGGEPLLRRLVMYDVIQRARQYGVEKIMLNTNGTLLNNEDLKILKNYDVEVCVSLDGAKPSTHDLIRGEGTFVKAVNSIQALVQAGVKTGIGTTLMQPNLCEVEDIVSLGKELGVAYINFTLLKLKGRARDTASSLMFSKDEILATLKMIARICEETCLRISAEGLRIDPKLIQRKKDLCGAGTYMLSVSSVGDIFPCDSLHDDALNAGNIRNEKLEDIWQNSPILKNIEKLSVVQIESCRDCELKFVCGGGCLADSFNAYGDFRCSPLCSIYREIYWYLVARSAKTLT